MDVDHQISELEIGDVEALLDAMKKSGQPAEIDWVNRVIRILGPVKEMKRPPGHKGPPLQYRDFSFRIRFNAKG